MKIENCKLGIKLVLR